ncbi:hypothetical protein JZ751_014163 [Albula glossodonta]|uniref:Uncharacterized protein n=1 Tax=Albula glossodonta TaxID=121402 RepID=A0A8T2NSQ2_9TELE|nr:hypothetical protein JZ751_014163 [Albula glossodonta]
MNPSYEIGEIKTLRPVVPSPTPHPPPPTSQILQMRQRVYLGSGSSGSKGGLGLLGVKDSNAYYPLWEIWTRDVSGLRGRWKGFQASRRYAPQGGATVRGHCRALISPGHIARLFRSSYRVARGT